MVTVVDCFPLLETALKAALSWFKHIFETAGAVSYLVAGWALILIVRFLFSPIFDKGAGFSLGSDRAYLDIDESKEFQEHYHSN